MRHTPTGSFFIGVVLTLCVVCALSWAWSLGIPRREDEARPAPLRYRLDPEVVKRAKEREIVSARIERTHRANLLHLKRKIEASKQVTNGYNANMVTLTDAEVEAIFWQSNQGKRWDDGI